MHNQKPLPVLLHIRHFGVGGIEAALRAWVCGLDRRQFAPAVSVYLPTREWREVYQPRFPADIAVHEAMPETSWLAQQHQLRRDHRLGSLGRIALGAGLRTSGPKILRQHLLRMQERYPVIIDFDHSLRRLVPELEVPVLGVRHFAFWDQKNAKARRVGRQLRAYDRVLVLNEDMNRQALALYGPRDKGGLPCVVMPNLFNLSAMAEAAKQPLSGEPELPAPGSYAVCVARLDIPTKGLDTLVRAWAQVVANEAAAKLVIVGEGPDRKALEELIRSMGLGHAITLAGLQTNPYPWIANARLLVAASRSEGASNVLVEALALGTPVVATDCPVGASDILQSGACGALVPVDDAAALAQAVLKAWRDADWRLNMSRAGMQRATDFSAEAGSVRLRAVLDDVFQERLARRR